LTEPATLAYIVAAASALGADYAKGIAGEAGKNTWTAVKSLFGWSSDPLPAEVPDKVTQALTVSPQLAPKVVNLLKSSQSKTASALVENLVVKDGDVQIVNYIENFTIRRR
jgi:hypothetical protein